VSSKRRRFLHEALPYIRKVPRPNRSSSNYGGPPRMILSDALKTSFGQGRLGLLRYVGIQGGVVQGGRALSESSRAF